ncbi:MAG: RdgB/HAM1 family non-canonical purine NTP pyrophosphatase [Candidatus Pelagibacterales bacterium]|tara:strand:+ start:3126 stop:3722 length:597 start_codon:yes stop_codon:yes gene_type:complete
MKEIIIASHNEGKVEEIRGLLKKYKLKIHSLKKFSNIEPKENGNTFIENSVIKAESALKITGLPSISDDSGLCVPALNNDPGIYSARWAGKEKNFALAIKKIEKKLFDKYKNKKKIFRAFFCCALTIALPDGKIKSFEGKAFGTLQFPPKGENGFGYDPIFIPKGYKKTYGEMKYSFKERISHRQKAFKKLENFIAQL